MRTRKRIRLAIAHLDRARAEIYTPRDRYKPSLSAAMEIFDDAKRQVRELFLGRKR